MKCVVFMTAILAVVSQYTVNRDMVRKLGFVLCFYLFYADLCPVKTVNF